MNARHFTLFAISLFCSGISAAAAAADTCPAIASAEFFAAADFNEVVDCLKSSDPVLQPDDAGMTALHFAALADDPTIIAPLAAAGGDPGAGIDCTGWVWSSCTQPLHLAAEREDGFRLVTALLAAGASREAADNEGLTPADLHRMNDHVDTSTLALLAGTDWPNWPESFPEIGPTSGALPNCDQFLTRSFMAEASARDIVVCLGRGARPGATNTEGNTAIHLAAAWATDPAMIDHLLHNVGTVNAAADLARTNLAGETPLHMAVQYNREPRVVARLLAWGAPVDALAAPRARKRGTTPLHNATRREDGPRWDMLALLIAYGANPTAQDTEGRQALHYAVARSPDAESIHLLLQAEALARGIQCRVRDCLVYDDGGLSALDFAAHENAGFPVLRVLLDFGFSPDTGDKQGFTPLMRYAEMGTSPYAFQLLLASSKKPCITSNDGMSVLAYMRANSALMTPDSTGNVIALEAYRQRCPD